MSERDDIARELRATRAQPRPEFARELDRRAADWLREPPSRWRMPSLRIALPALAGAVAAAVVLALFVSGDDVRRAELEVAIAPDQAPVEALGEGGAAPQALERDSAAPAEGGLSAPEERRVDQGEAVSVRYFFTAPTEGTASLAGRETKIEIPAGSGRLEIATEGLPRGRQMLEITVPAAPPYRERITIGG